MIPKQKSNLKKAYNKFANERDQATVEPWKFDERQRFLHKVQRENRSTLLELGAGPGRDGLYFQNEGLDVTCVDFSEEMVRLCKDKGLAAFCHDFAELPFADSRFDAVFALNCLLHVSKIELDEVLAEIHRVMQPGGLFFYGVYGGPDFEGVWEEDFYEPKRFFAMYPDEVLLRIVKRWFLVEDFHTVDMGEGKPHFQSLLLRNEAIGCRISS